MKSYLVLIPIFILALLQGAILPINLVLLIVLFWTIVRPAKESFLVAFLSGVSLDLAKGTPLGFSSLIFLVSTFLVVIYTHRFDPAHPLFLLVFVFLAATFFNLISGEPWLVESLILAVLSFLTRPLVKYYHQDLDHHRLKLKV